MTKSKPSDVLSRMKAAATREKPVSTAVPEAEAVEAAPAPSATAKPRRVRYTLDLEPEMHKDLKRFALEADVDASEVMRALLTLLYSDAGVRNAVLTVLSND